MGLVHASGRGIDVIGAVRVVSAPPLLATGIVSVENRLIRNYCSTSWSRTTFLVVACVRGRAWDLNGVNSSCSAFAFYRDHVRIDCIIQPV